MKNIMFRIPEELRRSVDTEVAWLGFTGQKLIETLVWERVRLNKSTQKHELNVKGETRADVDDRLHSVKKKPAIKLRKRASSTLSN